MLWKFADITSPLGNHQNLEAVLYGADSVYSKVHILRNSDDPLAVSIAQQELLALLGLAPNVYINPSQAGLTALKGQTFNASVASPLANSQPSSTTLVETA